MADNPIKSGAMLGVSLLAKAAQKKEFEENMAKQNELNRKVCDAVTYGSFERARKMAGPDGNIGYYKDWGYMHGGKRARVYCTKDEWLAFMSKMHMHDYKEWEGWNNEWGDPFEEIGKYRLTLPEWNYPGATWENMIVDMREAWANKEKTVQEERERIQVEVYHKDPVTGNSLRPDLCHWYAYKDYRKKNGPYDGTSDTVFGCLGLGAIIFFVLYVILNFN